LYLCCSFSICGGARSESRFLFRSQAECPLDLISSRLIFFISAARRCSVSLAASLAAGFCSPLLILVCGSVSAAHPLISSSLTQRLGCYFSASFPTGALPAPVSISLPRLHSWSPLAGTCFVRSGPSRPGCSTPKASSSILPHA
jgi:hypothetical protein